MEINTETFLSEIIGAQPIKGRHINMESLYEYGSKEAFGDCMIYSRKKNSSNYFWSGNGA